MAPLIGAPQGQVLGVPEEVHALRLPTTYPPIMAAYAGTDGTLWVRRWVPSASGQTVFDVFAADGRFRTVVVLPRRVALYPAPALSLTDIAAVGVDPETGAYTVMRFRTSLPSP